MDSVVSRLESGRAIIEDPPREEFPGIFVGGYAANGDAGGRETPLAWQGESGSAPRRDTASGRADSEIGERNHGFHGFHGLR